MRMETHSSLINSPPGGQRPFFFFFFFCFFVFFCRIPGQAPTKIWDLAMDEETVSPQRQNRPPPPPSPHPHQRAKSNGQRHLDLRRKYVEVASHLRVIISGKRATRRHGEIRLRSWPTIVTENSVNNFSETMSRFFRIQKCFPPRHSNVTITDSLGGKKPTRRSHGHLHRDAPPGGHVYLNIRAPCQLTT